MISPGAWQWRHRGDRHAQSATRQSQQPLHQALEQAERGLHERAGRIVGFRRFAFVGNKFDKPFAYDVAPRCQRGKPCIPI